MILASTERWAGSQCSARDLSLMPQISRWGSGVSMLKGSTDCFRETKKQKGGEERQRRGSALAAYPAVIRALRCCTFSGLPLPRQAKYRQPRFKFRPDDLVSEQVV